MATHKTIYGTLAGLAFFGVIIGLALHSQRVLERGLPPWVVCVDDNEAALQAIAAAGRTGGSFIGVLGTGSMAPYIPAAPAGIDPRTMVAAWVVTEPRATFADIRPGNLVIYEYELEPGSRYIHGAAQLTRSGWIMSGLNNERSESWARVTERNFQAIAAQVFVW